MSDELINDFEQEYQFVICQGLRFKVEQDWPLLSVISKMWLFVTLLLVPTSWLWLCLSLTVLYFPSSWKYDYCELCFLSLQFDYVWVSVTMRHVILFVFDCLVFVIGLVDVIIGNFYSLGVGCVWCPLPLSGNFYGNQFLQWSIPPFRRCTI